MNNIDLSLLNRIGARIDNGGEPPDDEKMSTFTREEFDARIETIAAKQDGRLEVIETRMDGRISSIEHMLNAKFAEYDASLHKTNLDTVKWIVGTALGVVVITVSLLTFSINNLLPKVIPSTQAASPSVSATSSQPPAPPKP